jgi:hypothetical protein
VIERADAHHTTADDHYPCMCLHVRPRILAVLCTRRRPKALKFMRRNGSRGFRAATSAVSKTTAGCRVRAAQRKTPAQRPGLIAILKEMVGQRRRRPANPSPAKPRPRSTRVAGSGTPSNPTVKPCQNSLVEVQLISETVPVDWMKAWSSRPII